MRRPAVHRCVLACAFLLTAAPAAVAATSTSAISAPPTPAAPTVSAQPQPSPAAVTGRITYVGQSSLTIQTGGHLIGTINALTKSANTLGSRGYYYVWGGGHGAAGVASPGIKGGPGANGKRLGYDCSGSVAAVLAGAGLWPAGAPVPNDAGVIKQLLSEGLIARGPASSPSGVTLYDHPGVHIFMNINGRFFGTSDGGGGSTKKGGPTWLDDGAPDAWSKAFKKYHFIGSVLRDKTSYGHNFTFMTAGWPSPLAGATVGDKVKVSYAPAKAGTMAASDIEYLGTTTATGTVATIAVDGSSVALQTAGGSTVILSTSAVSGLLDGLQVGASIQVSYTTNSAGQLVPHIITTLAPPATAGGSGVPGDGSGTGGDGSATGGDGSGSGGYGSGGYGSGSGSGGYGSGYYGGGYYG